MAEVISQKSGVYTPKFGASFSINYAKWLAGEWGGPSVGPRWQESLKKILEIKQLKIIRLSLPWRDFALVGFNEIDEALALCTEAGVSVIIAVGIKTPRWPEVYIPDNILPLVLDPEEKTKLNFNDANAKSALREWINTVVTRYDSRPGGEIFQIENEPLEAFGDPKRSVPYNLLKEEVELVTAITSERLAVTMGAGMSEPWLLMRWKRRKLLEQLVALPVDMVGFNVYQKAELAYGTRTASERQWQELASMIQRVKEAGKAPFIAELQAEPWQNKPATVDFKNPTGNSSFNPELYRQTILKAKVLPVENVLLWGLEFQVACAKQGNQAWLEATQGLLFS